MLSGMNTATQPKTEPEPLTIADAELVEARLQAIQQRTPGFLVDMDQVLRRGPRSQSLPWYASRRRF
jgi:hypothetical protein